MSEILLMLVKIFVYLSCYIYLWGLTVSSLWNWFAVPSFDLPSLTIKYAFGLGLIISILKSNSKSTRKHIDEKETEEHMLDFYYDFLVMCICYFIGFVVHICL